MNLGPCLAAALALAAALTAQNPLDRKAKAAFDKAERAVAASKYESAWKLYRQLARKYPMTAWGKVAAFRTQPTAYLGWGKLHENGPSDNRVDVVVMGDGYALDDQNEFEDVARSVVDVFRKDKVLEEYFTFHNFLRVNLVSKDQGVSGYGRKKETALGGYIAGKVQGQVGIDVGKAKKMLDQLDEHDGYAIAIVKAGSMGTGGGGIATIGGRADDTLVHEWGHAFGSLSDEYTTFTGKRGTPRNRINVSATDDLTKVPWKHFIDAKYPGIGAYRGAAGREKGAWKPTSGGCRMGNGSKWCPVCREQLVLQVYRRVDPIDTHTPTAGISRGRALPGIGGVKFAVTLLEPKTHKLDVRWHVLPQAQAIEVTSPIRQADRRKRGRLQPIATKGTKGAYAGRGKYTFFLGTRDLAAGKYQVVCRVHDDSKPSGQSRPWVLKDDFHLLHSERAWWVDVPAR